MSADSNKFTTSLRY